MDHLRMAGLGKKDEITWPGGREQRLEADSDGSAERYEEQVVTSMTFLLLFISSVTQTLWVILYANCKIKLMRCDFQIFISS